MSPRRNSKYVVCIRNEGYPASLETRKLYELLPDAEAEDLGLLRIVDESGEDYLFPKDFFVYVELPTEVASAVRKAS